MEEIKYLDAGGERLDVFLSKNIDKNACFFRTNVLYY